MEEDIKVLEEMIRIYKQNESNNNYSDYYIWKCKHERQAIENLIKRNKELESELQHRNDQLFLGDTQWEKYIDRNYIPKSVLQELIKNKSHTDTYNFKTIAVKDIEQLLQEGSDK